MSLRWVTEAMVEKFRYKLVRYRHRPRPLGDTEVKEVLNVLSVNSAQGWELDRLCDSDSDGPYRNMIFKQRIPGHRSSPAESCDDPLA